MNKTLKKSFTGVIAILLLAAIILGLKFFTLKTDKAAELKTLELKIEEAICEETAATSAKFAPHIQRNDGNIYFGITSHGDTAEEARVENQKIISNIMKNLTALGIDPDNLSHFNYSCYPEYNKHGIITGYCVSTNISITIPDTSNDMYMRKSKIQPRADRYEK